MIDIFSKRQGRGEKDIGAYKYDELSEELKVQVWYVFEKLLRGFSMIRSRGSEAFFKRISRTLREEYGRRSLADNDGTWLDEVRSFFFQQRDVSKCLDVIEVVFGFCLEIYESDPHLNCDGESSIRESAEKLNARFRKHSVGYEFHEGKIIRMDSVFLHTETVSPALALLHEHKWAGANQEFLKAHEHFRHGRFGEAINECLKAFESTLKLICDERKWAYNQTDTAKTLLEVCAKHGLFPRFIESSLAGLRAVLENVATVRNKLSGHGQGVQQIHISQEVAAFVIHSTGANILFLASLEKQLS